MYVTRQKLIDRFGYDELIQLTDRSRPPVNDIDDDVLNAAITDAEAFVDSHLQTRYQLPLAEIPPTLERVTGNVVRYYLYDDRATEQVTKLYNDSEKFLISVRDGKIQLGLTANSEQPEVHDAAEMVSGGNVFNRDDSKAFI